VCPFDRLLHSDLAKLTEDCRRANSDLECSRQEVENLKLQLQGYVSEVRRVEELLARKVCDIRGATFAVFFVSFHFVCVLNSNEKKGSCAAVNVIYLYVWMFALYDNFYVTLLFYEFYEFMTLNLGL
jgi:hypothetical protein